LRTRSKKRRKTKVVIMEMERAHMAIDHTVEEPEGAVVEVEAEETSSLTRRTSNPISLIWKRLMILSRYENR
jgi:uncharacterized protein with PhoU and TrkA domain